MTKLSLCMIVKNEETSLPQCLESIKDVVDELIVMDTGSDDQTVAIAESFGAQVPSFTWCDDFAAARNAALSYVSGDWVLVLDADEVLNPHVVPKIRKAISDDQYLVVNLIRQEIGAMQSPYSLVSRLFRRHSDIRFSRPYHALIDDSVGQILKQEPTWQIAEIPTPAIFHSGYQPSAIAQANKTVRARQAMENYFQQNPHDPYVCNKLGALYLQIGKDSEGIKLLKQGLKSNRAESYVLFELHYHLANAYVRQQKLDQAAKHYQKAIAQPLLPQLKLGAYNNLGSLLLSVGDLANALRAYQTVIKIDPQFAVGYYNLGMALKAMGRNQEALSAYQRVINLNPDYAQAYQNLGVIYYKTGLITESLQAFKRAVELYQAQNRLEEAQKLQTGLQELGLG